MWRNAVTNQAMAAYLQDMKEKTSPRGPEHLTGHGTVTCCACALPSAIIESAAIPQELVRCAHGIDLLNDINAGNCVEVYKYLINNVKKTCHHGYL